jgi:hypothetical protein
MRCYADHSFADPTMQPEPDPQHCGTVRTDRRFSGSLQTSLTFTAIRLG